MLIKSLERLFVEYDIEEGPCSSYLGIFQDTYNLLNIISYWNNFISEECLTKPIERADCVSLADSVKETVERLKSSLINGMHLSALDVYWNIKDLIPSEDMSIFYESSEDELI